MTYGIMPLGSNQAFCQWNISPTLYSTTLRVFHEKNKAGAFVSVVKEDKITIL